MVYLFRILIVVCPGLLGLAGGTWASGRYIVPRGSGLAGGPIALGYGLGAAAVLACLGGIAAYKLQGPALRRGALLSLVPTLVVYGGIGLRLNAQAAAEREPEAAFAPAGNYTAVFERLDQSDPYLFVKVEVDSRRRSYTQVGPPPKSQACSASLRSTELVALRLALDGLAAAGARACKPGGAAIKRLSWDLEGKKHTLEVSEACARTSPKVARALHLIESASQRPASKVTCQ